MSEINDNASDSSQNNVEEILRSLSQPEPVSRGSNNTVIVLPEDVPELKFVKVDYDLMLKNMKQLNGNIELLAFSKIRKTFLLRVSWDRTEPHYELLIRCGSSKILTAFGVRDEAKLKNYLRLMLQRVWDVHYCVHCNELLFETGDVCYNCENLSVLTYNDNVCIVCAESVHPIVFRCETCIDSQICILCETKSGNRKQCMICRKLHSVKSFSRSS